MSTSRLVLYFDRGKALFTCVCCVKHIQIYLSCFWVKMLLVVLYIRMRLGEVRQPAAFKLVVLALARTNLLVVIVGFVFEILTTDK